MLSIAFSIFIFFIANISHLREALARLREPKGRKYSTPLTFASSTSRLLSLLVSVSINFVSMIVFRMCKANFENPVGIMSSEWRKPDQIINPYEFGDPYEKKTCLWLKGLPKLTHTNVVKPEPRKEFKSGNTMPGWYSDAWKLPKDERAKIRSKTFSGIADAMVNQWSEFLYLSRVGANSKNSIHQTLL